MQTTIASGSIEDGARDLSCHVTQGFQGLAVVVDMSDVHFRHSRVGVGGVDQQTDIHAVVGLERQLLQKCSSCRNDTT